MKKWGKVIGIVAVVAVAALCLVACGGSGGGSAASSSSAQAYEPIYVVKDWKMYSNMGDGGDPVLTGEWVIEYDEHGNTTKQTIINTNPTTNESEEVVATWSGYDEYGYASKYDNGRGDETTTEWTIEDGHAVKAISTTSTAEFTYYDDGKLKSQVIEYPDRKVSVEYDENGRQVKSVTEGGDYPQTYEKAWVLDDRGHVKGVTGTTTMEKDGQVITTEYTVECDENGNAVTVKRDGVLAMEFEYQKIDNPSQWAWVCSWNPRY